MIGDTWDCDEKEGEYLFRGTMLKIIHSENLEYEGLAAQAA